MDSKLCFRDLNIKICNMCARSRAVRRCLTCYYFLCRLCTFQHTESTVFRDHHTVDASVSITFGAQDLYKNHYKTLSDTLADLQQKRAQHIALKKLCCQVSNENLRREKELIVGRLVQQCAQVSAVFQKEITVLNQYMNQINCAPNLAQNITRLDTIKDFLTDSWFPVDVDYVKASRQMLFNLQESKLEFDMDLNKV